MAVFDDLKKNQSKFQIGLLIGWWVFKNKTKEN
jgi:hypothetical protein